MRAPSHRARDHEMLFRSFSNLAIKVRTEPVSERAYDEWEKERIEIEKDEPPIYIALEADCDNEVRRAWGRTNSMVKIGFWSRLTMNWIRHAERSYNAEPTV